MKSLIFAVALLGCARFHSVDDFPGGDRPDAAMADSAVPDAVADSGLIPDAAEECLPIACPCGQLCVDGRSSCAECPDDERCLPHELLACSSEPQPQWYWTGRDCEVIVECPRTGSPTRRDCLANHTMCAPGRGLEERSFVFFNMKRSCTSGGDAAWSFTFIPFEDAVLGSLENVALGLREDLDAPSAEVNVQVLGALDPFHDLAEFNVGDADLSVELCELGACGDATEGMFSFETGGAGLGSTTIDVRFGLEPVAVDLNDTWFAYETGIVLDCWR